MRHLTRRVSSDKFSDVFMMKALLYRYKDLPPLRSLVHRTALIRNCVLPLALATRTENGCRGSVLADTCHSVRMGRADHSLQRLSAKFIFVVAAALISCLAIIYVCVFVKLYITAQPGLVILTNQCYSYGSTLRGSVVCMCMCECVHYINRSASNLTKLHQTKRHSCRSSP